MDDLQKFNPKEFVEALFDKADDNNGTEMEDHDADAGDNETRM